jgi:tetratricopeptide (TPR) repeat protein
MKTKALYIYAGAVIIIILAIFLFSQKSDEPTVDEDITENQTIPNDSIHNPHGGKEMPNAENIRPDFMERFNELKEKHESDQSDTAVAREYAGMLSQAHRKGQAIELYLSILKKDPERTDLLMALAYEYYEIRQLDNAEDVTNRLISLNSENTQAIYNLGSISIARGDTSKAIKIWQDLLNKYPDSEAAKVAENSLSKLK